MHEPQRPAELSEATWEAMPLERRQFIALLVAKLAALEAQLNQNSQNSSKPPSSEPPSAAPRPTKTPRGKPKPKAAQPAHPDQQRELLPLEQLTRGVALRPSSWPTCQHDTVSATCQQHSRPLLPFVTDAITAYWAGQPCPSLFNPS